MGVLDEAIRQHLELKRKHGAEEGEIARQEQEALGPARRDVAPPEEEAVAPEPAEDEAGTVEEPVAEPGAYDEGAAEEVDPAGELADVEEYPLEEGYEVEDPLPLEEEGFATEPLPAEEAYPADDAAPPGDLHADAEAEGPPADPDAAQDVLEETPDFLEETPEHDRLWFEQKPPRDFDFDE